MRRLAIFLAAVLVSTVFAGTTYEVGTGKTYSDISGVPWATLAARRYGADPLARDSL